MNRIRDLRMASGISMKEAARRLGLPYTTYVNYEKGAREPNSEVLIKIADFFGVSIDYLIKVDGTSTNKAPTGSGERSVSDDDIKFALFRGREEITDAMYEEVLNFAEYVARREEEKKRKD